VLKMQVINRLTDGLPILKMEATDRKSRARLTALYKQMEQAQMEAIRIGMADIHNTCGSSGDMRLKDSIIVGLLLGGTKVVKRGRNRA
jgi:hypothetical protein